MKNRILINIALALLPLSGATQIIEDPIFRPDDQKTEKIRNVVSADKSIAMQITETPLLRFIEETTGLIGFKRGDVVVFEPQFDSLWCPYEITHIAIARRQREKEGEFVYLTSQGLIIDSVRPYFFDNGPDAEYNGFIRFRHNHSEHVGLLNRHGEVVIPAIYNDLSHVRNGFLPALIGADTARDGEYTYFVGGEELLLDTLGRVHINDFRPENSQLIDFYSIKQIHSRTDLDTTRINYLSTKSVYYSFENYETAFAKWLDNNLLSDFTPQRFKNLLYPEVRVSIDYGEWQHISPDMLVDYYYDRFYQALIRLKDSDCEYFYSRESFYPGYGNYREPYNTDEHPIVQTVITSPNGVQEYFDFYRTDHGYRLIEATFRCKSYGDMD